jgi:Zn-finger nucleic acid-binding protein
MLTCPACSVSLSALTVPVGVAAGCGKCGGVFLDDAAFGHFRDKFYETILTGLPTTAASTHAASPASSDPRPPLLCASCQQPMTRTTIGEVEIDLCSSHGTWFDQNELIVVARIIAHARAFAPKPQSPAAIAYQPDDPRLLPRGGNRGLGAAFLESLFADDDSLSPLLDAQMPARPFPR